MKNLKKHLLFLAIILLIIGCNKKQIENNSNPDNNQIALSMSELNVSNEFDWKLSHEISILVDNPQVGTLKITSLDGKIIFHKENYSGGQDQYNIKVTIPDYVDKILVNNEIYNINGTNAEKAKNITSKELAEHFNSLKNSTEAKGLSFGSEFVFNSGETYDISAAPLDATHFIVAYGDTWNVYTGTAVIGTIVGNTITWSSEFVFNNASTRYVSAIALDATHFVVTYSDHGNSQYGTSIVGTISGNNISWGPERMLPLEAWSIGIDNIATSQLDASHFVVAYRDIGNSSFGTAIIGLVSGDIVLWGNEYVFNPAMTFDITSTRLGSVAFVLAYRDGGNLNSGTSIAGSVALNTISFGPEYVFNSIITRKPSLTTLNSNKIVVAFRDGNPNFGAAMIGNIAGTTITYGPKYTFNNATTYYISATTMDADNFIVSYQDGSNNSFGTVRSASVSGNVISWVSTDVFNSAFTEYVTATTLDPTNLIISYTDNGNSYYGTSIACSFTPWIDTDLDGVPDGDDDYPNDPLRAYDNYFPAAGYGTLAFEDIWTSTGDYDFNDLVEDYRFQTVTNASNEVVEVFGVFITKALGAGNNNSFGFNLPNANPTLFNNLTVTGYDIKGSLVTLNGDGLETGQTHPTIIVFDQSLGFTNLVNTLRNSWYSTPVTTTIKMVPSATYTEADFALSTFNPFIIIAQTRGRELHLPDYEPSDLINISYYQTWEDDTQPGIGKYFKTVNNLPWAINLPESFAYPYEYADITTAFTHFQAWAESGGVSYTNWYQDEPGYRNVANIYTFP
ncbi:MAG: LruC domain-containing protein [Bacteroidales bacterium]|nr:LruC domain-containing protein [Bacteroidales bacterium]